MNALFEFHEVGIVRGDTEVLTGVSVAMPDDGVTALDRRFRFGQVDDAALLQPPGTADERLRQLPRADVATLDPLAHRRRVAMVFQAPTVFAGSALDNLRAADPHLDAAGAASLLSRVGLPTNLIDREADTMSGGEAQRLCLARALATKPEAILADEATSALDESSTAILEQLARSLAAGGTPVVWVTHDLAQMRRLADHVVQIDRGRVTFAGTVGEHTAQRRDGAS